MQGFDYDLARAVLKIPDEFEIEAMAAVGRPGKADTLPEKLQKSEAPNARRPLTESVREGLFSF